MASEMRSPAILRFGAFEVDLHAGELRKQGKRIKVQDQPFQVLAALLQRPNDVVTREELRKRIWPEDTFVDFDNSLNTAINKLREALGDSADNPRFVETLPRRGYRFLLPVVGGHPGTSAFRAARWMIVPSVTALAVVAASIAIGLLWRGHLLRWGRPPHIESLAVLPLLNLSGDPQQEYFADGMTDELTTTISRISELRVTSRTSAMEFKGTKKTVAEIAKELNVDALVEGSVTRSGNRVRVTAQLIEARADSHLWANDYERDLRDVLTLQDEVARDIANEIRVKLTPEERTRLAAAHPIDPETNEAYLKGRYYWAKNSVDGMRKGIEYFQQAIEKDPRNAQAYAGLAGCYNDLAGGMAYLSPQENFPKAKAAATKALEIDDTLAEAHAALGWVRLEFDWDWASAEREFRRAIEFDPSSAVAHRRYSTYLVTAGRFNEALAEGRQAQELDPLSQHVVGFLGYTALAAGRYDEAISQFKKAIEFDPGVPWVHAMLAWTYARKGMYGEAIAEHKRMGPQAYMVSVENQVIASGLGWVYALAGKRKEATRILEEFNELPAQTYVDFYQVGVIYAGLGDKDRAFRELDKAYAERSVSIVYIKADPFWDQSFRSDARYASLLQRMGLPR